jgi:hypothetical protein
MPTRDQSTVYFLQLSSLSLSLSFSLSLSLSRKSFFLIGYLLYLHFKCYPHSQFHPQKPPNPSPLLLLLWVCSPTHPSTPSSPLVFSYSRGHWAFIGPRASSAIDAQQGHTLLHMWLEPWVLPCVLLSWWFSPWELGGGGWLVDIAVLLMGLETPSAPSVLSLTPWLGLACSGQWLAASIRVCICLALAETLRRQLYQTPINMHFLASIIVSAFGDCIWDGSPGGTESEWPFIQVLLHMLPPNLLLGVFCSHF